MQDVTTLVHIMARKSSKHTKHTAVDDMDDDEDDEDSFVTIGSAMPLLAEDDGAARKPVSLQDQTVHDEQGRRRFHGAFTGGFSAGYFNTVGSKEGWTPQTFVSSKQERVGGKRQRPEDFMDDEDFGEFGIAPRQIATTKKFSADGDVKKQTAVEASRSTSVVPETTSALAELIMPARLSIGARLLRKLGWRPTQGIGPRVKRKRKHKPGPANGQKVYGCALPIDADNDGSEGSDDDIASDVTFAPKDVQQISFAVKDDVHGIGYEGLNPAAWLGHRTVLEPAAITGPGVKKGKRGIRGQAFGVGAMENDDEDIYGVDSLTNYDVELTDEFPDPKKTALLAKRVDPMILKSAGEVLLGFLWSSASLPPKKLYPPPDLPRDFKPFHKSEAVDVTEGTKQSKMNAFSRAAILGEAPHLKSVFELVSAEDRAKVEAAKMQGDVNARSAAATSHPDVAVSTAQPSVASVKSSSHNSTSMSSSTPGQPVASAGPMAVVSSPVINPASTTPTGAAMASCFKPFAKNPQKQERYERFLEATRHSKADLVADPEMTEWEQKREREEFTQAARLYRPLSNMIASRFTTAKCADDDVISTTDVTDNKDDRADQVKAASMKMYGRLTRDDVEWHPDKNLCKRFNVANPYPDSSLVGVPHLKRDKYSVYTFLNFPSSTETEVAEAMPEPTQQSSKGVAPSMPVGKPLAILDTIDLRRPGALSRVVNSGSDVSTSAIAGDTSTSADNLPDVVKPPVSMDLFKAIFDNSDTSGSSESEEESNVEPLDVPTIALTRLQQPAEMECSGSVESDEKIDNSRPQSSTGLPFATATTGVVDLGAIVTKAVTAAITMTTSEVLDNVFYGPALPSLSASTTTTCASHVSVSSSRSSRSESHHRHKRSHKHDKEHRHHSHKSKHKKHKEKKSKHSRHR